MAKVAPYSGIPIKVDCRGIEVTVVYRGEDIVSSAHVEDRASAIGLLYNAKSILPCDKCWKCCQAFNVPGLTQDPNRRISKCVPLHDWERTIVEARGFGGLVDSNGVIPATLQGNCSAFKDGECVLQPFMPIACRSWVCQKRIVMPGEDFTPQTLSWIHYALNWVVTECVRNQQASQ